MGLEIVEPLDHLLQRLGGVESMASGLQEELADWRNRSPANKRLSDFLNGTWLGHSLHATLTDLTIGAWTGMILLDGVALAAADDRLDAGADVLLAIGLASVPATALAGLADWQYTSGRDRRIGLAHALTNATVGTLMGGSLALRLGRRARARRGKARLLSSVAFLGLLAGAYLGGDLAYRFGVGVSRQAWTTPVEDFRPVLDADALADGQPRRVEVDGRAVVLVRQGGRIHALAENCTHMGGPLSEGRVDGDCITCPWHGSQFALADGAVRAGPATAPQPAYEARVRDGKIEVRSART
jgi:nitrite reductase/ring-hydroxylating ferredoxin subunit/uncharacterized membrane protein